MLIYTIAPIEEVLKGLEDTERELIEVEINGIPIQIEMTSPTSGQIVRVFSSDPQDFLDPNLQPGITVPLGPERR
mgnify:FL=1